MNDEVASVRRLAPTDRRSPRTIEVGRCPGKESCYCCLAAGVRGHGKRDGQCPHPHPNEERKCNPPYPSNVWPCPERKTLSQEPRPGGRWEVCVDCGRVTGRRWTDPHGRVMAWCGGLI